MIKSRQQRRNLERKNKKDNKKQATLIKPTKKFSKKWLLVPLIIGASMLSYRAIDSLYFLGKERQAQVESLNKILNDNTLSPLEKSVNFLRIETKTYYEILEKKPSNFIANRVYNASIKETCQFMMSNTDFNEFINSVTNPNDEKQKAPLVTSMKDYFRKKGYFFCTSYVNGFGKNYLQTFLAKIDTEQNVEIPLFDTEKKCKARAIIYHSEIVPNFMNYIYASKGLARSDNFSAAGKGEFLIDGTQGEKILNIYFSSEQNRIFWGTFMQKYKPLLDKGMKKEAELQLHKDRINYICLHEGTHIFTANLLLRKELSNEDNEALPILNEVINGPNPRGSIFSICNIMFEPVYNHAKEIICPQYTDSLEQMSEDKIRNTAREILNNNYSDLLMKLNRLN